MRKIVTFRLPQQYDFELWKKQNLKIAELCLQYQGTEFKRRSYNANERTCTTYLEYPTERHMYEAAKHVERYLKDIGITEEIVNIEDVDTAEIRQHLQSLKVALS